MKKNLLSATVLMILSGAANAYVPGVESGVNDIALGYGSSTTGVGSIAIGQDSFATGSDKPLSEIQSLLDEQKILLSSISDLKNNIANDEEKFAEYLETIEKVERNKQAIAELTVKLDAANQNQINIVQQYDATKIEYDQTVKTVAEKKAIIDQLDFSTITPNWETDGGLDTLAQEFMTKVESGTDVSLGLDFYKDYLKNYVEVEAKVNYQEKKLDSEVGRFTNSTDNGTAQTLQFNSSAAGGGNITFFTTSMARLDKTYTEAQLVSFEQKNATAYQNYLSKFDQDIAALKNQYESIGLILTDDKIANIKQNIELHFANAQKSIDLKRLEAEVYAMDQNDPNFGTKFNQLQNLKNESETWTSSSIYSSALQNIQSSYTNDIKEYKETAIKEIQNQNANNIKTLNAALDAELKDVSTRLNTINSKLTANQKLIADYENQIASRQPTEAELLAYEEAKKVEAELLAQKAELEGQTSDLQAIQAELQTGENATAVGVGALAKGSNSLAIGTNSKALAFSSIAIGENAFSDQINAIAIGKNAKATANVGDVALGANSVTNAVVATPTMVVGGVTYSLAGVSPTSTISVGSAGNERTITNVAAGRVSSTSTDAVNGSQLNAVVETVNQNTTDIVNVNNKVDTLADNAVQYNADKTEVALAGAEGTKITNLNAADLTATSKDAVNGSQLYATNQNVSKNADDIKNIQGDITNIEGDIVNVNNKVDTLADNAVQYNADKTEVALAGAEGTKITNLNAADLTATSKDAVNGSQLYATNQNVSKNADDIKNIQGDITNIEGDIVNVNNKVDTLADNAVQYNADKTEVALAGAEGTKITNLNAADLTATSKDAVNGSQLYATNQNVSKNADDIKNIQGDITNIEGDIKNIQGDVTNIQGDIKNIQGDIVNVNNKVDTLADNAVQYNADKTEVALAGAEGTKITNLNAADLTATSKDAVNGSQLYATNQNVSKNADDIKNIQGDITNIEGDIVNVNNKVDTLADNAVQYNADKTEVAMAGAEGTKITNLNAADLTATSKDAVNGSQLYATNQNVSKNADDIKNIQGDITNIEGDIVNVNNKVDTLADNAVQYNADKTEVALAGAEGTKITNLNAADLTATSKDAVNGSQLYATNQNVSKNADDIKNIQGDITNIEGDIVNVNNKVDTLADNAVQYNADKTEVALAGAEGTKITNLNAADLTATSKDAVNGSQLYATNQNVSKNADDIKNIQGDITNIEGDIVNVNNKVDTLADNAVQYNADKSKVVLAGTGGTVISNVKDGQISATSKDAVNGSQLYHVANSVLDESKNYTDSRVDQLNRNLSDFSKKTNEGIASALAVASLPQPTEKGYSMLSIGTGVWESEQSIAIGASGVTEDKQLFNVPVNYVWKFASTATASGSFGGGASVGVQWK